ncbi:MAG: hypothetical protein JL50_10045 [Peptococcaceae bacterium BICA1-7]|nr:MAG: hypothetical protein JL50_10045 [Peptococcaceae bacterium BICA1-7]HBV95624.1 hypothetical protein [Desulfotomaculum sp.]
MTISAPGTFSSKDIADLKALLGALNDSANATGTALARLAELLARLTTTRAGKLDLVGSAYPVAGGQGTLMEFGKLNYETLNTRLTATRAGYLDQIPALKALPGGTSQYGGANYTAPDVNTLLSVTGSGFLMFISCSSNGGNGAYTIDGGSTRVFVLSLGIAFIGARFETSCVVKMSANNGNIARVVLD